MDEGESMSPKVSKIPGPHIRRATSADVTIIAEFNLAIARETEGKELDRNTVIEGVANFIAESGRGHYFVAEIDGRIVGQTAITYEWSNWRNGEFWWIQSVYVHPDHRGTGIFRALYRHVESLARLEESCCGIRLYMERDNANARQTYLKLGMAETGYKVFETTWQPLSRGTGIEDSTA